MKLFYTLFAIPFFIWQTQDLKLSGIYKMEYEKDLEKYNCTIIFNGDTYEKKTSKGKKINGKIEYQNNFIKLSDDGSLLQMSLPKREVKNDTIYFRTLDSLEVLKQKKPLMVFTGKLIKIK